MTIQELAEKYELDKNDFWELRKNSGKWIITHDACEKIAQIEGIIFEKPEILHYQPTTLTENGEKVQTVKYGKEYWRPAWAGKCQKVSGDVAMVITAYRKDNPDYKVWTTGEANGLNCQNEYLVAMAEKRGVDRCILKLINAYEYGIYSDVESDEFKRQDKAPTEKQLEMLHNLASDLGINIVGVDKLNREEVSQKIDEFKCDIQNKESEEYAKQQQELIKE